MTIIYLDILRYTTNKVLLLHTIMRTEETFVKPPQSKFRVEHNCTTPLIQTGNCHFKLYNLRIVLKTLKYSILRLQTDYSSAIKSLRLSQVDNVAHRGKIVPYKHRLRRLPTTAMRRIQKGHSLTFIAMLIL